ncbi:MAG: hypothetical protein JJT96_06020 [Opitutales bacterium]|nr:hypothetical protein [Opitutales bacterium]
MIKNARKVEAASSPFPELGSSGFQPLSAFHRGKMPHLPLISGKMPLLLLIKPAV